MTITDEIIETMVRAGTKAALEAGGRSYSDEDIAPGTVHYSEVLRTIRAALESAEAAGMVMVPVDPALTCPGIDEALALTDDPKLKDALERVRFENSNMRYSSWHWKALADERAMIEARP